MIQDIIKHFVIALLIMMAIPTIAMAKNETASSVKPVQTATVSPTSTAEASVTTVVKSKAQVLDTGNTAWIFMATILVMLMTIPGLALFYGGLVRSKNILNILMQCLMCVAVISILWFGFEYSWVFGTGFYKSGNPLSFIIGGFDKVFMKGVTIHTLTRGNIPEFLFALFQCMFAVITPGLIVGAFAERMKFSGFMVFTIMWSILVYCPMAHWVWGGGWIQQMGAIDFAGGTVVHINAGISALVMAIMLGKRRDYKVGHPTSPHNIPFVFMGAAFLWLGWFGFNAGSGLCADGLDANAFLVTHLATCVSALVWMAIDWIMNKKPTTVGVCTGAVAGLVSITPAAGSVDILGAIVIGAVASLVCFFMVAFVKYKLNYDDALDAFGVHGIGGIVGSILTGVFATKVVTGGAEGALFGNWHQLLVQLIATFFTIAYSAILTIILFYIVNKTVGIRVAPREEEEGVDIYEHGETAYN